MVKNAPNLHIYFKNSQLFIQKHNSKNYFIVAVSILNIEDHNYMKRAFIFYLGVLVYLFQSCSYLPEEINIISGVAVKETVDYISLEPQMGSTSETGLLFYPGGLVDPHAYIPTFQGLVLEGYKVVIVKVSANLAITNIDKASSCKSAFPEVEEWVLSGHSLGGAVTCIDVHNNPTDYVGVVLMASYPSEDASLVDWDGAVLSLFGALDGLATPQKIDENAHLLPTGITVNQLTDMPSSSSRGTTIYHQINGGNHAQFGSYGKQNEDGEATISVETQHTEIVNYIQSFFNANNW